MIQGNARTITASKGCAECILNFRTSLLRWWSELYGQTSRGYAHFIPRHYRDWEVISGFRPGLQNSDLGYRFSVFRLRTLTCDSNFDIGTFLEIFLNIPPGIKTLKRCLKGLGSERANKMNESRLEDIAAAMFEPRTTSGSQLLSYLRCFQSTLFILLSIGLLVVTISLKIWVRPISRHANCSFPVSARGSKALRAQPLIMPRQCYITATLVVV